jgi:hypothetical protein
MTAFHLLGAKCLAHPTASGAQLPAQTFTTMSALGFDLSPGW